MLIYTQFIKVVTNKLQLKRIITPYDYCYVITPEPNNSSFLYQAANCPEVMPR